MYLNIGIRSKNYNSLKSFVRIFKILTQTEELKLNKILKVFQKKRFKKIFTILRSPHVNKSAQEQFEYNLFAKHVNIKSHQILKTLIILKKIKTISFSDIELKIKFIINPKSKKDIFINNLKLKKIRIGSKKKNRKIFKDIDKFEGASEDLAWRKHLGYKERSAANVRVSTNAKARISILKTKRPPASEVILEVEDEEEEN